MMPESLRTMLTRRASQSIEGEAPSDEEIKWILHSGMCANDHGNFQPWEFRVFLDSTRSFLASAFLHHECEEGLLEKNGMKAKHLAFRAPLVICVSTLTRVCGIPVLDQHRSAASACQLISLAVHALSYHSIWRTGKYAESNHVKRALGISQAEEIVGFIYIGSRGSSGTAARPYYENRVIKYD